MVTQKQLILQLNNLRQLAISKKQIVKKIKKTNKKLQYFQKKMKWAGKNPKMILKLLAITI